MSLSATGRLAISISSVGVRIGDAVLVGEVAIFGGSLAALGLAVFFRRGVDCVAGGLAWLRGGLSKRVMDRRR